MHLHEKEIFIPLVDGNYSLLDYFSDSVFKQMKSNESPVRLAVTRTEKEGYYCELGVLSEAHSQNQDSIFDFKKRAFENIASTPPQGLIISSCKK